MEDQDFDNLFKHKFSNLPEPQADMGGWESISGQLKGKAIWTDWKDLKLAAASVLILSNIYFFYQWQHTNSTLAKLKTQTENSTIASKEIIKPKISSKKIDNTNSNNSYPSKQSQFDQKTTPTNLNTPETVNNIRLAESFIDNKKTTAQSFKAQIIPSESSNHSNNKMITNVKTNESNTAIIDSHAETIQSNNESNIAENIISNSSSIENQPIHDENSTHLDQVNINTAKIDTNLNTSLLTTVEGTQNETTSNEKLDFENNTTSPEVQKNNQEEVIQTAPELPSKKNFTLPMIRIGSWVGGAHAYMPKANSTLDLNYGLFTEVGIWKGISLGILAGRTTHMIESDKPDCFKNHPPHHPDPDFKFRSLVSKEINIFQYGLSLKYEFDYIKRWRPYVSTAIIAAKMDPLDVKFKFDGKKPGEEKIIEERIVDGSNEIQGINFTAGISYRFSNRLTAFTDANYLKNIQPDPRRNFDNSTFRMGIYFQL